MTDKKEMNLEEMENVAGGESVKDFIKKPGVEQMLKHVKDVLGDTKTDNSGGENNNPAPGCIKVPKDPDYCGPGKDLKF